MELETQKWKLKFMEKIGGKRCWVSNDLETPKNSLIYVFLWLKRRHVSKPEKYKPLGRFDHPLGRI